MSTSKSTNVLLPLGPRIITAYSEKLHPTVDCPVSEGKTKQEFRDECDINVLMKRYQETGSLEHVQRREALYADVSSTDFQTAMDILADANTAFNELPSHIRDRFNNDPKQMLAFVEDDANLEEAAQLGLLSAERVSALAEQAKADKALEEAKQAAYDAAQAAKPPIPPAA